MNTSRFIVVLVLIVIVLWGIGVGLILRRYRKTQGDAITLQQAREKIARNRGRYIAYLQRKLRIAGIAHQVESVYSDEMDALNKRVGDSI